jgi:hypothetical protein
MFADWTDPYDIDHYYDDVGKIFSKVAAYTDPTQPVITSVPVSQLIATEVTVPTVTTAVKSGFEVVPNSIFLDGHSVGSPPPYNILRSGSGDTDSGKVLPQSKDTYINRYGDLTGGAYARETFSQFNPWMIILWIIIGMLVVQVIKLNIIVCSNQMILQSLMHHLGKKM